MWLKRMLIASLGLASRAWAQPEASTPSVATFPEDPTASPAETPHAASTEPAVPSRVERSQPPTTGRRTDPIDPADATTTYKQDERDGFFFHLSLGGGAMAIMCKNCENGGFGASEGLLVGGTPAWWLVLGGALTGGVFDLGYRTGVFALIGPFAQFYVERSETLYFRGLAGLAVLKDAHDWQSSPAVGLGIGGEGRLTRAWRMGPVLQVLLSGMDRDTGGHGGERTRSLVIVPTISLGITQH